VLSDEFTLPNGTLLHTVRIIYRIDSWSGTCGRNHGSSDAAGGTVSIRWRTFRWPPTWPGAHRAAVIQRLRPGAGRRGGARLSGPRPSFSGLFWNPVFEPEGGYPYFQTDLMYRNPASGIQV